MARGYSEMPVEEINVLATRFPHHQTDAKWSLEPSGSVASNAGVRLAAGPTKYRKYGKRLLDLVGAGALLVVLSPLFVLISILVLSTSGWPVFYRSRRVGRNGVHFQQWKFRTMLREADELLNEWRANGHTNGSKYETNFKIPDDPRITTLGRILRKSSLDELPQLWNVLIGQMSLVGPRPLTDGEVALYGSRRNLLLSVRPGMTGRWQVSGRNSMNYEDRMSLELEYASQVSLLADLEVLVRTPLAVVTARGAS